MNQDRPFVLKAGVIAFATVLMAAFVVFRGQSASRSFSGTRDMPSSWEIAEADSPLVDTTVRVRLATPHEQQERTFFYGSKSGPILQPAEGTVAGPRYVIEWDTSGAKQGKVKEVAEPATITFKIDTSHRSPRTWMSTSKSFSPIFPEQALVQHQRQQDSIKYVQALRTLVFDRYGRGGQITLDSLQRRMAAKRWYIAGSKSAAVFEDEGYANERRYLDSLLNALMK